MRSVRKRVIYILRRGMGTVRMQKQKQRQKQKQTRCYQVSSEVGEMKYSRFDVGNFL
jgi:hypothetical protein